MKIYCYNTREYIKDAGTPDKLNKSKKNLKRLSLKMETLTEKYQQFF